MEQNPLNQTIPVRISQIPSLRMEDKLINVLPILNIGSIQSDQEGAIQPVPILVKRQLIRCAFTSTGYIDVIGDIATWLGVPASELYKYELVISVLVDMSRAFTYDLNIRLYNGATTGEIYQIVDAGRSAYFGSVPIKFYPDEARRTLQMSAPDWSAGTENSTMIVTAYKIPGSVATVPV